MKTEIHEYDGQMQILLEPETMEEQVQLVRLGMNAKDGNATISTNAYKNSGITTTISAKKYHRACGQVRKNK